MNSSELHMRPLNILTPRELEVLRLLASGCSYKQIARSLGVSLHTVVTHVKNTYRKLDAHNGAGAVMRAIQFGLMQPEKISASPMLAFKDVYVEDPA